LNGGGTILGDWRMENEENFFSSTGEKWRKLLVRRFHSKAILHSPRATKGVTLSPWRSYPIGSSFSSFSILHSPKRCDNPYCLNYRSSQVQPRSAAHRFSKAKMMMEKHHRGFPTGCARGRGTLKPKSSESNLESL
jgi:hypothetical protein